MIGAALYTICSGITHLYPVRVAQEISLPFATYEVVSDTPHGQMANSATILETDIQITAFASTYDAADTLAQSLIATLDRYSGTVGSVVVRDVRHLSGPDDFFEDEGAVYGRSFLVKIWAENYIST